MAERKTEPVEERVEDAPASTQTQKHQPVQSPISEAGPSSTPEVQSGPRSSPPPSESTSCVRNAVLDGVVAQQRQRISQLERQVDKRKETLWLLSSSSPFVPPPGLGVLPPQAPPTAIPSVSAAPPSPAVQPTQAQPHPLPTAGDAVKTQQQQQQSQPLAHNPAMAATMAAMAAASARSVSASLHPQYPFFPYPHPDSSILAPAFMGVVPTVSPHPTPQSIQPPSSTTPSQPNQASEDGGNRQSRYWTPDEHQRYLAAVSTFGPKNYQQIAEVVGTRNARQVRTHSQKFQKKLEREEARRRGDPRPISDANSSVRINSSVAPIMNDGAPALVANQFRQNEAHRGGPATASSKNLAQNEAPQSAKSAEGSSSTNNVSSERNAESSADTVHASAKAAAAAAVAAEAFALSYGRLPPGTSVTLNRTHGANSPTSGTQTTTRRPRETKIVKPVSSHVPTPNCATSINPRKSTQTRNQETSKAAIHPSPPTNVSAPRPVANVSTSISAGRGAESHKGGGKSRVGPEKQIAPKLAQSDVKMEPKVVVSMPNSNPISGPCSTLATTTGSRLQVLRATSQFNGMSSQNSTKQVLQKPMAEVAIARLESEVDSNGLVNISKEVSALASDKRAVVPNGQHGTRPVSQKVPQLEADVLRNAHMLSLPPASMKLGQNVSASTKPDSSNGHNRCEVYGNGERLGKSDGFTPSKLKTAEQREQQTRAENSEKNCLDREPQKSPNGTHGRGARDGLSVTKNKKAGGSASMSKSEPDDGQEHEQKDGFVQQVGVVRMECEMKDESRGHRPVVQAMCSEDGVIGDSLKSGSVMGYNGQTMQTLGSKSGINGNDTKMVMKTRSRGGQADEKQCCNGEEVAVQGSARSDADVDETDLKRRFERTGESVAKRQKVSDGCSGASKTEKT